MINLARKEPRTILHSSQRGVSGLLHQSRPAPWARGVPHAHAEGGMFIELCWGYNQQGLCVTLRASLGLRLGPGSVEAGLA